MRRRTINNYVNILFLHKNVSFYKYLLRPHFVINISFYLSFTTRLPILNLNHWFLYFIITFTTSSLRRSFFFSCLRLIEWNLDSNISIYYFTGFHTFYLKFIYLLSYYYIKVINVKWSLVKVQHIAYTLIWLTMWNVHP